MRGWVFWAAVALFLAAAVFVNPFRQVLTTDDFAYARMVEGVRAGRGYHLHQWASASLPVQTYAGALLTMLLGDSFGVLRLYSLGMFVAGVVALRAWLTDRGAGVVGADLWASTVLSCQLAFHLAFTFMTDVSFVAWMIIASWLYSRAFTAKRVAWMALASVAAAAAIGTRQFGVALIGGAACVWWRAPDRGRRWVFYASGLLLPAMAMVWQLDQGLRAPTAAQAENIAETAARLLDLFRFLPSAAWRLVVAFQYLALFLWPVVPVLAGAAAERWSGADRSERRTVGVVAMGWMGGMTLGAVASIWLREPMPSIGYFLNEMIDGGWWLSAATAAGGALIGAMASVGVLSLMRAGGRESRDVFPVATAGVLLVCFLVYCQRTDEYLLALVPFVAVLLEPLARGQWSRVRCAVVAACAVCSLLSAALWTRGALDRHQAAWEAAEWARATGAPPSKIAAELPWAGYYGAFDEWVAIARRDRRRVVDGFAPFLEGRQRLATFGVAAADDARYQGWIREKVFPYGGALGGRGTVVLYRRPGG